MKVKKTTQSLRRHAFSSFRERVDLVKIDPSRNLVRRVYEDTDTSHFLATLDHWKEVNISGNFSEFIDKVENYVQSLPQLIYHQKTIYTALLDHIKVNDPYSIQPLLELLAQFVHDLGPDFMPFYLDSLSLLTDIAVNVNPNELQNSRNPSNALEWTFNCMAFIFKYLSRSLAQDLLPTFKSLLPILQLKTKRYIARYCSEALLFLVRKLKDLALKNVIQYSLYTNTDLLTDEGYCQAMVIMYSESMKLTAGSFHAKSGLIFLALLSNLNAPIETTAKVVAIVNNVILEVLNHGTPEACTKFYQTATEKMTSLIHKDRSNVDNQEETAVLMTVTQILITLSFAESGKKISTWSPVVKLVEELLDICNKLSVADSNLCLSLVYLVAVVFRNCSLDELTKCHTKFIKGISSLKNGNYFLLFLEVSQELTSARMKNFAISKYETQLVEGLKTGAELRQLALYILRNKSKVSASKSAQEMLWKELDDVLKVDLDELNQFDILWRLVVLQKNSVGDDKFAFLILLFNKLAEFEVSHSSSLGQDLASIVLELLVTSSANDSAKLKQVFDLLFKDGGSFQLFKSSHSFIKASTLVIDSASKEDLEEHKSLILHNLAQNLSYPNHETRLSSIQMIHKFHFKTGVSTSDTMDHIYAIESMPLTISTARDVTARIRTFAVAFSKSIKPSALEKEMVTNFLFGLLTNKFQPCWLGVYEALPLIQQDCSTDIWAVGSKFLTMDYSGQEIAYAYSNSFGLVDDEMEMEPLENWFPQNSRILGNFKNINENYFKMYDFVNAGILEQAENIRGTFTYEEILRNRVLQAFAAIPLIAESHSEVLVPLVLHELDVEDESDQIFWSLKDRNALVELFTKFKNLKKVYRSDDLKEHLLKLLCNKNTSVQKLALQVLLNWKEKIINKYRDNLLNLLDDTIYRDELSKFIVRGTDSDIEDADLDSLMPIVLRILFGRAQSSPKSNSQTGRKFAVVTVLPNLSENYIEDFLRLGSERIGFTDETFNLQILEIALEEFSLNSIRRINGYVRLLASVLEALGSKFKNVLASTVEPLIYSLAAAQDIINANSSLLIKDGDSDVKEKSARNTRQAAMRCLNELFQLLGSEYDWSQYGDVVYKYVIQQRLENFESENLQQPSALLKVMTNWINYPNVIPLLFVDDYAQVKAILKLLGNVNTKNEVILTVLEFTNKALTMEGVENELYYPLVAYVVDSLLSSIPLILERSSHKDVNTLIIDILLVLISKDYIDDNVTRGSLVQSLSKALDKPSVSPQSKVGLLTSLSSLIDDYDCSWVDVEDLYDVCCKSLRIYADKNIRLTLVKLFNSFANRFEEVGVVGEILQNLNSFSGRRMDEPDFEKRLDAFKKINETLYKELTVVQWLPIVYCSFFFINDIEELVMRTNATYTLNRFTDAYSSMESAEDAKEYLHVLKNVILPNVCVGLRKSEEVVQTEYISVLEYLITNLKYYNDLDDMKVLLFGNDEEANFFRNVNHIQLHRRQRAIMRLRDYRNNLTGNSIAHYILPIIEHYVFSDDEKLRNIANETVETISYLVRCINWKQYKALFRRYVSYLTKSKPEQLKDNVSLIVSISESLLVSKKQIEADIVDEDVIKNMPTSSDDLQDFVTQEAMPPLRKILNVRNDETITSRIRLAEALTNYVIVLPTELVESNLAGILTSTCQVLRSRSEELRDAVRKSLGRVSRTLGAQYFRFILQELKTSLSRGSQIHVLSFTVHALIVAMKDHLSAGDLDESASLVVHVIMEDIFGSAGQEKDADGYTSKMKEVKHNKSYDTGELLSSNISLSSFGELVLPVKMLLQENVSLKIQNKLDELIRRYSLGLNHNEKSSSLEILHLCYELHNQAVDLTKQETTQEIVKDTSKEGHFLVKLNAKPLKTQVEYGTYISTLQKFSFDLLRTAITRHEELLTIANLTGFVPLLEQGLQSSNEGVVISSLRVLTIVVRLPFQGQIVDTFKKCSRTALNIVKDCPLTNSELCQACLRFIATIIRNNEEVQLKETAISYLLIRIQPDLEEPNRQGLAFAFVKAVLSQHIVVADLYDTMDKISNIMITNHTKEIRDMSRSAYFQFLMEYDQGKGRLEKQFKFLLNNLSYGTQDGRLSVLELLHLIIQKSGTELLVRLASSFFLGLANVAVSDESPKCREMGTTLLSNMFKKLGASKLIQIVTYCSKWLTQKSNALLRRCGLNVYKIYVSEVGFNQSKELDDLAKKNILEIILSAKNDESSEATADWEDIYVALSVFTSLTKALKGSIFNEEYASIWYAIVDALLYPHAWVRLSACRLIGLLIKHLDDVKFELSGFQLQTIAVRLLHQMGAPSISESLGTQVVKNLAVIAMKWNKEDTKYELKSRNEQEEDDEESAIAYMVGRICFIMRQDSNYSESFNSKKASIQLAAMLSQIIPEEQFAEPAEKILLGLFSFNDLDANNSDQENEIVNLSRECHDIIEKKLGVTEFSRVYAKVKQTVDTRRRERRTKRALLKVTAPDVAAKRNLKKHERTREKRKHVKDSNGYYKSKRNKFN